jgi:hypothetical protein
MITKIYDNQNGLNITIEPETVEEFTKLLRFSRNASSEKPHVYLSFQNEPYCNIWLTKRKPSVQKNSINPETK